MQVIYRIYFISIISIIYIISSFKLSRFTSVSEETSTISKVHFFKSYVWLFWRFLFYTFFLLMCAAYLLASTAVEVLSNPFPRDQLSSAFYSTLATFSRWMVNRCVLLTCAFTKITRSRVHDVLSNSQRLLRQAHASHRCIKPEVASD